METVKNLIDKAEPLVDVEEAILDSLIEGTRHFIDIGQKKGQNKLQVLAQITRLNYDFIPEDRATILLAIALIRLAEKE